jgi:phage terminase large subunit
LDWGYVNDPTVLVEIRIKGKNLFVMEHFRVFKTLNDEIARLINEVDKGKDYEIVCDNNEAKSIQELQNYGINAFKARKGADSVYYGINKMQLLTLHLCTSSDEMIEEFELYRWKRLSNGEYAKNSQNNQIPIKNKDHAPDSARYALIEYYRDIE